MRQIDFGFFKKQSSSFGGSSLLGKRKTAHPLSTKKPLHLVLKSESSSLFNPGNRILEKIIRDHAKKYSIAVYALSFNWSHIHLVIKLPTRESYRAFIRTVTAALLKCLAKQKGKSLKGVFDLRPFTRILNWGRDLRNVINYHELNDLEGWGLVSRKKKKHPPPKPSNFKKTG
ncbi:MAG TPA: transposase [Pseudobdellovibrionaceae bacterium]